MAVSAAASRKCVRRLAGRKPSDGRKLVLRGTDDDLREWGLELERCMGSAPSLQLASSADGPTTAVQAGLLSLDEAVLESTPSNEAAS